MAAEAQGHTALRACPFCGDAMENRGYGAIHVDDEGDCPIVGYAIDPAKWNRRVPAGDAAPDLLAALRLNLAVLETARPWITDAIGSVPNTYQDAIDLDRAAIAKAEGRS